MKQTANYQLNQWEKTDRVQMEDFNADNAKVDAALNGQAEALAAVAAANCYVKLMDLTLAESTQQWDIDMRGIDLTQYQKLVIYPHLNGNCDQNIYMRINNQPSENIQFTSSGATNRNYCGLLTPKNDTNRYYCGVVQVTMLIELPHLYVSQDGFFRSDSASGVFSFRAPKLDDGVTHLNTLNFYYANNSSYQLLPGSTVQIYGFRN